MTTELPEAHSPAPADQPLALKSNLVLGPNAETVERDPTHAWTLAQRCELAEKCLPVSGFRAQVERLHADMLAEVATLRSQLEHWKTFAIHAEGEHAAWKKTATELDEELRALKAAAVDGRTYTQADLLEAVKTERHACSICVWMVLQDALEPGADDKGLEGWMREAEQRVRNRLAHQRAEAPLPQKAPAGGFCWLVELFEPEGSSMGHYHTGATTLSFESRTTRDPLKAKRYATKRDALLACAGLLHLQGAWRAVEHGFGA